MIGILAAAATVTASPAAPQWLRDGARPPLDAAIEQVADCKMGRPVAVFDEDLQEEVLRFPEATQATDEQLACVATVSWNMGWDVEVPQQFLATYWEHYGRISEPYSLELARDWLARQGLLDGLPQFVGSGLNDAAFAAKLEDHCGPDAKGLLSSRFGPHAVFVEPEELDATRMEQTARALLCLMSAGTVAGFDVGFIGNEMFAE